MPTVSGEVIAMRVAEAMVPIESPLRPDTPLLEAARQMAEAGVPALPVCDGGKLVGVLSERALVFGAVQEDSDGDAVPAAEGRVDRAMLPAVTCRIDEDLDAMLARISGTGARHLVVLDERGKVAGVLSLRPEWKSEAPADGAAW
jgi:CBS domain-containing protein